MFLGVVLFLFGVIAIALLGMVARLYFMINDLNASFAKLGYVIREDAKKYFDEAADKIIDTNEQFQSSYTKIVRDGTMSALGDAGTIMEKTLENAHREAGLVVLKAREDAQRIIVAARHETENYNEQALNRSADMVQWVISQYTKETFTIDQHKHIINKLLDEYINEHRS